jgi:glycosyltransferase involved in cell wall biosynthesis
MSHPLISVIVPTCNRRQMLGAAIESVTRQTYREWELIIVNDASRDGTDEAVENWVKKDKRIIYEKTDITSGGSVARNIGIARASGEFMAFLDDDDTWLPAKLEKQLELLKRYPDTAASSCWFTACYIMGERVIQTAWNPDLQQILSSNVLGSASVCMARASVIRDIGGFSEKLPSAQDWDLWVRLRKNGAIVTVREPLVNYSVHKKGKISADIKKKYVGFRRFCLKHSSLMTKETRRSMMSLIAYIKSRSSKDLRSKIRWLLMSLTWSRSLKQKAGYVISVLYHLNIK